MIKKQKPTRGWSGAVVGVGMLMGKGFACFLSFKVSWFHFFWFLGFKVSKIHQIPISCFPEDIDPISNILKILLDRSAGFVETRFFQTFRLLRLWDFPKSYFEHSFWFYQIILNKLAGPKSRIMVSGGHGHDQYFQKS